jgi:large conductance mechanosensitive channel
MKRNGARSFLGDFKDFIHQGNVVDLAVAVVIGGAFGKVVDALVSLVVGGLLEPAMKKAGAASIASWPAGSLLVALINFVVIAFVVFLIVRAIESMKRKDARAAEAAPAPDPQEQLALAASRLADALKRRQL